MMMVACGATDNAPATTAPIIPPTDTMTPIPTNTLAAPTFDPRTPTADPNRPTWTPSHTPSQAPTNTPLPTQTTAPTQTPLSALQSGLQPLPLGGTQIISSEADLNAALQDLTTESFLAVSLLIEADGLWATFIIENTFLEQRSQVRTQAQAQITRDGQLTLSLATFQVADGPSVARQQVQAALTDLAAALQAAALAPLNPPPERLQAARLAAGFLIVEIDLDIPME